MIFFKPVILLMNRLRYLQKFALIAGILAIPLALMAWNLIGNKTDEVNKLQLRQKGAKYDSLLKDVLQDVQQHRALSVSVLNGDVTAKANMQKKQEEIEKDFETIKNYEVEIEGALNTKSTLESLYTAWKSLASEVNGLTAEQATAKHISYIAELLKFMQHVTDDSNLLLARSVQNYYLIENVTKNLPLLTEQLGQIRAVGMNTAAKKAITEQQIFQLIVLTNSASDKLQSVKHATEVLEMKNPALFAEIKESFQAMNSEVNQMLEFVQTNFIASPPVNVNTDAYYKMATSVIDKTFELYDKENSAMVAVIMTQTNDEQVMKRNLIILLVALFAVILYSFLGFYFAIRTTVNQLTSATKIVADGDLTQTLSLQTKDEMSKVEASFNEMVSNLRHLVQEITKSSELLASSSEELTASAEQTGHTTEQIVMTVQEVATGTNDQLQQVEDITSKITNLASGVQGIAEGGEIINASVAETLQKAVEGSQNVRLAIQQMGAISSKFEGLSESVTVLGQRSDEISEIVKVITSISAQTNLLALNAAIEAARAGEQGRGFAVVAGEVRKLAEQSSESAAQIANLITAIQDVTKSTVSSMDDTAKEVAQGIGVVNATEVSFEDIQKAVNQVVQQTKEVSATTQKISNSAEQVAAAATQIHMVAEAAAAGTQNISAATEEQLASMEEISASSSSLSHMAEELQLLVKRFKV
ncbi:methyl-accepting chemotaxis protein [Paenibacillus sp. S-38]|uniref:methyl-accepting chemotaxis protein n=1 Tax=Paenibacillus sp. S-38 TaxID=3416710 RepID=UPI003CEA0FFB